VGSEEFGEVAAEEEEGDWESEEEVEEEE